MIELAQINLKAEDFHIPICRKIYSIYLENVENQRPYDLLSLAIDLDDAEGQLVLSDLVQKKINKDKAEAQMIETIQKMLDRNWMQKREEIKIRIQSGHCSEEEVLQLVKEFGELKRTHTSTAFGKFD